MNLKTLLISTLIALIACTTCVEARRRLKSHRNSPSNKNKSQSEHSKIAENVAKPHINTSPSSNQAVANAHSYKSQSPNPSVGYPRTVSSATSNQPVYFINSPQQNSHSSGNDDFIAGYVVGSAVAQRKRRRKTTTVAPTTTKNPCLNEASMSGNNLSQNLNNTEAIIPPCEALSHPTDSPTITIKADNTQTTGNAVAPEIRRKRRRKTTTVAPTITKNPCLDEASMPEAITRACEALSHPTDSPTITIKADNTQTTGNAVAPKTRRKRRRKTTTNTPITTKNPYLNVEPMPSNNQPQQQISAGNFETDRLSTVSPGNTNVNANSILFK